MTASRDPDPLIRAYLADGPTELPRRSYEAVDEVVDRTRQRAIRPWRNPHMSNLVRLGVGLAAVIVAAVIGLNFFRYSGTGPGGPGPAAPSGLGSQPARPSPTASPKPVGYTWPGTLDAGTYSTSLSWGPSLVFSFTVPDGWESRDINILKNESMTVKFLPVANVVTDACKRTLPKTPAGSPTAASSALAKLVTLSAGPRSSAIGDRGATYVGTRFSHPQAAARTSTPSSRSPTRSVAPDAAGSWAAHGSVSSSPRVPSTTGSG